MQACPWCGFDNPARGCASKMPAHCPRCERGVKNDWDYCAWCYGPGFVAESDRFYPDKRYTSPLRQCTMPRAVDAVHALLPVVPHQSQASMEDRGQQTSLHCLQMGYREGVLELLRLVPRADKAGMTVAADKIVMLEGAEAPHCIEDELGGGAVIAYSDRSPDKETENEDTVAAIPYGPDAVILVVADGVGGLPGGKRASETAVTRLSESLHVAMTETMLLRTAILDGIEAANQSVLDIGNGSATTMTVVTIEGRIARTYQVGDSEAIIVGQRGSHKIADDGPLADGIRR